MKMNKKGFTLVELMVVLAILGLLAGIGIPQYMKTLQRARETNDLAALASFQSAIRAFMAETNFVPPAEGTLVDDTYRLGLKAQSIIDNTKTINFSEYWTGTVPVAKSDAYTAIQFDKNGNLAWTPGTSGTP